MKKHILILKLFIFSFFIFHAVETSAQTNVYHPFPDSNAVWRVDEWQKEWWKNKSFQYVLNGDTIIGTYTYKKVDRTGDCCYTYIDFANKIIQLKNGYIAALREDTLAKKVFIILKDSTNENLLYNFNMNVGDTLKGFLAKQSWYDILTIGTIDSIVIDNHYRKRYRIFQNPSLFIIEGIGSSTGTFEGFKYLEAGSYLICFKLNNKVLYPDTSYSCTYVNSVDEKGLSNNYYILLPNKTNDGYILYIKTHISIQKIVLNMYDILGKEKELSYTKESDNSLNVKTNNLKAGIYFLVISDNIYMLEVKKIIIYKN